MKRLFDLKAPYRPRKRRTELVEWPVKGAPRSNSIYLEDVPFFSARGLRPIYGRGDPYPIRNNSEIRSIYRRAEYARTLICKMDMWRRKDGLVLVRFHTRRQSLDTLSFELRGLKLPRGWKNGDFAGGECVPETVRDRYEEWVDECICYPNG